MLRAASSAAAGICLASVSLPEFTAAVRLVEEEVVEPASVLSPDKVNEAMKKADEALASLEKKGAESSTEVHKGDFSPTPPKAASMLQAANPAEDALKSADESLKDLQDKEEQLKDLMKVAKVSPSLAEGANKGGAAAERVHSRAQQRMKAQRMMHPHHVSRAASRSKPGRSGNLLQIADEDMVIPSLSETKDTAKTGAKAATKLSASESEAVKALAKAMKSAQAEKQQKRAETTTAAPEDLLAKEHEEATKAIDSLNAMNKMKAVQNREDRTNQETAREIKALAEKFLEKEPHECMGGAATSEGKKEWCCKHKNIGCEEWCSGSRGLAEPEDGWEMPDFRDENSTTVAPPSLLQTGAKKWWWNRKAKHNLREPEGSTEEDDGTDPDMQPRSVGYDNRGGGFDNDEVPPQAMGDQYPPRGPRGYDGGNDMSGDYNDGAGGSAGFNGYADERGHGSAGFNGYAGERGHGSAGFNGYAGERGRGRGNRAKSMWCCNNMRIGCDDMDRGMAGGMGRGDYSYMDRGIDRGQSRNNGMDRGMGREDMGMGRDFREDRPRGMGREDMGMGRDFREDRPRPENDNFGPDYNSGYDNSQPYDESRGDSQPFGSEDPEEDVMGQDPGGRYGPDEDPFEEQASLIQASSKESQTRRNQRVNGRSIHQRAGRRFEPMDDRPYYHEYSNGHGGHADTHRTQGSYQHSRGPISGDRRGPLPRQSLSEQKRDAWDCTDGIRDWRQGWAKDKKQWCCQNKHVGCED